MTKISYVVDSLVQALVHGAKKDEGLPTRCYVFREQSSNDLLVEGHIDLRRCRQLLGVSNQVSDAEIDKIMAETLSGGGAELEAAFDIFCRELCRGWRRTWNWLYRLV